MVGHDYKGVKQESTLGSIVMQDLDQESRHTLGLEQAALAGSGSGYEECAPALLYLRWRSVSLGDGHGAGAIAPLLLGLLRHG